MDCGIAPPLLAGIRPHAQRRVAMRRSHAALSVLVHAALLAAILTIAVPPRAPPAETAVKIEFLPPPAAVSLSLPQAALAAPQPERLVSPLQAPPPQTVSPDGLAKPRPPRRARPSPPKLPAPAVPAPATAPNAALAAPGPAAAKAGNAPEAVKPATPPADALAALEARIRSAVQAALVYPPAARFRHEQGRVRVRFDYQNGEVGTVAVAVPSGAPLLDDSALATVRRAAMPRPPAAIGTRRLSLLVWVDFGLTDPD